MQRVVFGVSGASGMALARSVLHAYTTLSDVEIHLIVSDASKQTMLAECHRELHLEKYATKSWPAMDFSAPPASGSWQAAGMIICPCSMHTLGAIANGCGTNLIHRSADVTLKERRPLVVAVRETPYSLVHLRNMTALTEAGGIVMPFVPAFYSDANDFEAVARQFAGRMLDLLRLPHELCNRWREDYSGRAKDRKN